MTAAQPVCVLIGALGGEGGGVMMNQAPHIMDIFTLLGGMPKKVNGRIATVLHDIEVEDLAEAMLEYRSEEHTSELQSH